MPLRRTFLSLLPILAFLLPVSGQDRLFTQAFVHPVDINPALAGNVPGRYRLTAAYRDQWQSLIDGAFKTIGVYGDLKIPVGKRSDDFVGAGFSFIADRTAFFNANQNIMTLSGSFHKALNPDQGQFLSAGLTFGIAQRSANYENLFFNDQFNGLDQYNLPTNESLPANNFAFMDLGLGINYSSRLGDYSSLMTGVAVDHIPGSSISLFNREPDLDEPYPDSRLDRKFTVYAAFELASNQFLSVLPRVIYQKQGPHAMLSGSAVVKFDLNNYDNQAAHLGGGIRLNQRAEGSLSPSAAFLMAAYEAGGFLIGLSHDITLSRLAANKAGRGAFEISLTFTGQYENSESLCPTF